MMFGRLAEAADRDKTVKMTQTNNPDFFMSITLSLTLSLRNIQIFIYATFRRGRFSICTSFATRYVRQMKSRVTLGFLLLLLTIAGCKSAYYSAWEKFGVYKRDLLKKNVQAARDEEKAASEQFKDALTRLKEMYGFQGGDLEKTYNTMQSDYDRSVARANTVHKRVKDVESVANDLFKEWQKEIGEMSSEKLRAGSQQKLHETQRRYDEMFAALKRAEKSMDPVLTRFHDQVLYLKHNLNAAAIASLQGESTDIQNEISRLLQDMNQAIARADQFINTLQ